ncbi:MAG: GDSL-type esterase/lipase family protein [Planctomycetota bacterium]
MPRLLKRSGRILLSCALTLVLLEVGLQLLALVMSGVTEDREASGRPRRDGERVVLCVGDSYTFGMGAKERDGAYPAQLQQRLNTVPSDSSWQVVNGGRPGRDSFALLADLDRQLQAHQPDFVCVLVGINDKWRRRGRFPEEGSPNDDEGGLRTVRLFKLLVRGVGLFEDERAESAGEPSDASDVSDDLQGHPLLGRWQVAPGDAEAVFWPDGTGRLGDGSWRWRAVGSDIVIEGEERATRMRLEERGEARVLWPEAGDPLLLTPAGQFSDAELEARRALSRVKSAHRAGDFETCAEIGLEWVESGRWDREQSLSVLPLLVDSLRTLGRSDDASTSLERCLELHRSSPDRSSANAVARSLSHLGDYREAYRVASDGLALSGDGVSPLTYTLVEMARLILQPAEIRELIERRLREEGDLSGFVAAWLHVWLPSAYPPSERFAVMAAELVAAQKLDPGGDAVQRGCLVGREWGMDPELLREAAERSGLADSETEQLLALLLDEAVAGSDSWLAVLEEHISRIATRCREAGAEVVIGCYPFRDTELRDAIRRAAEQEGLPFADVFIRFPADGAERAPLFVPDGHCSDEGYALFAETFADVLIERVQGR